MDPELEIIDDGIPAPNVSPDLGGDDVGFDIIEEDKSQTPESLAAELEKARQELEALKQNSDISQSMQQGFQTLAQQLNADKKNDFSNLPGLSDLPSNQNSNQQFSLLDKESFEKDFFTNPYDAMQRFLAPIVGSQNQAVSQQMAEMNKMISKNNAYMNESNREILNKYGDEVNAYDSRLPGNDPWGDAIKQVQ